MLRERDRGLWRNRGQWRRERGNVSFLIFVAGKDVEGSDPLQTRAFPVEGHVGFFG